jgi:hypothetical protein
VRRQVAIGALVILGACGDDPVGTPRAAPPAIEAATISANPHNVVSAIVSVRARDAEFALVRFRVASAAADDETLPVPVTGDVARVPVLGLLPEARYVAYVVATGPGGETVSPEMEITTGALPQNLPRYIAGGPDPSPGYVVFAAGQYVLAIDNAGRVAWYRHFPGGAGLNVMAQPTGRYVLRPPTPATGDLEPWVELDPLGEVTRTLGCAGGLQPRLHDILLEPGGGYWLLCDETRTTDLSADGGAADARVTGNVIQHIGASGELLFSWNPFDHFAITDLDPAERAGAAVNWTHGNAIDVDGDGNVIVSWRNLGEITKIDGRTGAVIWRMGGARNEFHFFNTSTPPFARQHAARAIGRGELLLLDNVGDPGESRAERYAFSEDGRTASLVHSHGAFVVTEIGGSVQRGAGGRTLVSFGTAGRVEEYDDAGQVVWRIHGNPGYVFRAQRIHSLYAPGVGTAR